MINLETKKLLDNLTTLLYSIRARAKCMKDGSDDYFRIFKINIEKEADEAITNLYKLEDDMKLKVGDSWPTAREIFTSPDGGERTDGRK